MNDKPVVHIKEWGIYRRHINSDRQWAIEGIVTDHPRFKSNTMVTTSSILVPDDHQLSELKDGDTVETRNTTYILVGNNTNSSN
jgi:hypothetical protein